MVNDWGLPSRTERACTKQQLKSPLGAAMNLDLWHPSCFRPPAESVTVFLVMIAGWVRMSISWQINYPAIFLLVFFSDQQIISNTKRFECFPDRTLTSYQLLLQRGQGRLQPLLLSLHRVSVQRADRLLPVQLQGPAHHVSVPVPEQPQLLQPGQRSLQPLPHPPAVHRARGGALPAQHALTQRSVLSWITAALALLQPISTSLGFKLPVRIKIERRGECKLLPQSGGPASSSSLGFQWTSGPNFT